MICGLTDVVDRTFYYWAFVLFKCFGVLQMTVYALHIVVLANCSFRSFGDTFLCTLL